MAKFSIDREMRLAKASERKRAFNEAEKIYKSVLERFPSNIRAKEALSALLGAIATDAVTRNLQKQLNEISVLYQNGKLLDVVEQGTKLDTSKN